MTLFIFLSEILRQLSTLFCHPRLNLHQKKCYFLLSCIFISELTLKLMCYWIVEFSIQLFHHCFFSFWDNPLTSWLLIYSISSFLLNSNKRSTICALKSVASYVSSHFLMPMLKYLLLWLLVNSFLFSMQNSIFFRTHSYQSLLIYCTKLKALFQE